MGIIENIRKEESTRNIRDLKKEFMGKSKEQETTNHLKEWLLLHLTETETMC